MQIIDFDAGIMHKIIPPGAKGNAAIVHDSPTPLQRLRGATHGQPLACDTYTRLLIDGYVWMTDAEFEYRTNLEAVLRMRGDVLVAGLGIAFMIYPLLCKNEVDSVTVVERNRNVLDLVISHLDGKKLKVVEADAFTWKPERKQYNAIYFDLWADIPNSYNWSQIVSLKRQYRTALRPKGWMKAWCENYAK